MGKIGKENISWPDELGLAIRQLKAMDYMEYDREQNLLLDWEGEDPAWIWSQLCTFLAWTSSE